MKRFLMRILIFVLIILTIFYCILFTSFGNNLLKPYIQEQIDKHSKIKFNLDNFVLRFGEFDFLLNSPKCISIHNNGKFSLFTQEINAKANIKIDCNIGNKQISTLNTNHILIENVIKGTFKKVELYTTSNIGKGNIIIYTRLNNLAISKLDISANKINIKDIIKLFGDNYHINGILNINASIKKSEENNIKGNIITNINDGEFLKDDNKNNPVNFRMALEVDLNGKNINHGLILLSSIGNIESTGITQINNMKTNGIYKINLHNLEPLSHIVKTKLSGSLLTSGIISGNNNWIDLIGDTNFAQGKTKYTISLKNYSILRALSVQSNNLRIEKLLSNLGMPVYAIGNININLSMKYISDKLNGIYKHNIQGHIQKNEVDKEFNINLPDNIKFHSNANVIIGKGEGILDSDFKSDITDIYVNNAVLKIKKDNVNINAPYQININDLKKLKFLTKKELTGKIKINGEFNQKNNDTNIRFASNIKNGKLNGYYKNGLVITNLVDINSLLLLEILNYPKIFSSSISGRILYDTLTKKGEAEFILSKGKISKGSLDNIINRIIKYNIKNDAYDNIKIKALIDKDMITTDAKLISRNSRIELKNTKINLQKESIVSDVYINVDKNQLTGKITGPIENPSINIDAKVLSKNIIKNFLSKIKN